MNLHQQRHAERCKGDARPERLLAVGIAETESGDGSPHQHDKNRRSYGGFEEYGGHDLRPPLALAIFAASRSSSRRSSMRASTIPASTSSREPRQKRSAIPFTARAAATARLSFAL